MTCSLSLSVAIVNYCTGALVEDCLASLATERAGLPDLRVAVIDNASPDESADWIAQAIATRGWSEWVQLVRSPRNIGFGAGSNLGIRTLLAGASPPDLVWCLNPDTRVQAGAGRALIDFMTRHPQAGIAGSALLDADARPWPIAFRFPTILGEFERGARSAVVTRLLRHKAITRRMKGVAERVDWVSGASFVIRRELPDAGLWFDECFFLYYEETDLCLRAARAGWECWYAPEARVLHIAGQSTKVTGKQAGQRRMPAYWFESRRYYFRKNHGWLGSVLADIGWMAAHMIARAKQAIRRAPDPDPPRLLTDFIRHSALALRRTTPNAAKD